MLCQVARKHAGGFVLRPSQLSGRSNLLSRVSSSAAAPNVEPIERLAKDVPAAALPQENPTLEHDIGEAVNSASTAASEMDNSKVVAVYAGAIAVLGGIYLTASGEKSRRARELQLSEE